MDHLECERSLHHWLIPLHPALPLRTFRQNLKESFWCHVSDPMQSVLLRAARLVPWIFTAGGSTSHRGASISEQQAAFLQLFAFSVRVLEMNHETNWAPAKQPAWILECCVNVLSSSSSSSHSHSLSSTYLLPLSLSLFLLSWRKAKVLGWVGGGEQVSNQ